MLPENPILLPEIIDQIFLVAVHPASQDEHEEVQSRGHSLSLLGRHGQYRPCVGDSPDPGRFFAPYDFAYNFIKIHRTLRVSPAMAARVTTRLWEVADLVALLEASESKKAA